MHEPKSTTTMLLGLLVCLGAFGMLHAGQRSGTRISGISGKVYLHGDKMPSRGERATLVGFSENSGSKIRFAGASGREFASCRTNRAAEANGSKVYYCSVQTEIPSWAWQPPGESSICSAGQYSAEISGHFTRSESRRIYRYDEQSCRICERDPEIQGCASWLLRVECSEPGKTTLCADG